MIARYEPRLALPSSVLRPALDLDAGTESAGGSLPLLLNCARTFLVLSLDSCTLGWANGSMPRTEPAIAVAISQRRDSPPRASLSRRVIVSAGWPAFSS